MGAVHEEQVVLPGSALVLDVGLHKREEEAASLHFGVRKSGRPEELGPAALEPFEGAHLVKGPELIGLAVTNAKRQPLREGKGHGSTVL
jgi:hypothetical protein